MNRESFDFLGFTVQKFYNRRLKRMIPYMRPSKKALNKVKDSIREITCRKSSYEGLDKKVLKLNPIIRGWRNYFEHGNSYKQFMQLDEYMWMRLWRQKYCQQKQHKYRDRVLKEFRQWYKTSKLEFFCTSNKRRYAS